MQEMTILYILALVFSFVTILYGLHMINKKILTDKYIKESRKLQLYINNLKREYGDLVAEPSDFIGQAIGNLGIEQLLGQFGIDASILQNPIVKGFLDKYLKKGGASGETAQNQRSQV